MTEKDQSRLGIDWAGTLGGVLAAVSSAVLLSRLGAAGTLIGAALGSLVISVGTSLYSSALQRSKAQVARAQEATRRKVALAQAELRRAGRRPTASGAHLTYADEELTQATMQLEQIGVEDEGTKPSWKGRLAVLPWKRIVLIAGAFFLVAMLLITSMELITGKSVSGGSGTTLGHAATGELGRGKSTQPSSPTDAPTSTETSTPSNSSTTPSATQPTPTAGSTSGSSPTSTPTPTRAVTPTRTAAPTTAPTPPPTSQAPTSAPSAGAVQ